MTDKLRESMRSEAEAAGFAPVDLDAVVTRGSRTVRRRRTAAVGAGVAAITAVVVLVLSLATPAPERTVIDPAEPVPFPTQTRDFRPFVAVGTQVFLGSETVELDDTAYQVDRVVRTADAFVFQSGLDRGEVATIRVRVGEVTTDLGPGSDLAADQDGHLAAWLDADGTGVVVLDTRDLQTRTIDLRAGREPARLHDVEGRTLYATDTRGAVAIDLVTGGTEEVEGYVVDVEADVVVTAELGVLDEATQGSTASPAGLLARSGDDQTRLPGTRSGILSPSGRWFATPDLLPAGATPPGTGVDVLDTATGTRVGIDTRAAVTGEALAVEPTGWLDDDTLTVSWVPAAQGPERLLTCEVSSGVCEVAVPDLSALPGADAFLPVFSGEPPFDRR